tara:strand:+ start:716 stop:1081 length:366 start_codon:yes stop_codon:yes gene_type:complete
MKIRPTFFNTRSWRYNWNYTDTNNWLFKIIYKQGGKCKEQNYILRDIKQDKSILKNIYKKLNNAFDVVEIETSRISKTEYDMLKNINTPTILNCVKTERLSGEKLQETKRGFRQNNKLQEA